MPNPRVLLVRGKIKPYFLILTSAILFVFVGLLFIRNDYLIAIPSGSNNEGSIASATVPSSGLTTQPLPPTTVAPALAIGTIGHVAGIALGDQLAGLSNARLNQVLNEVNSLGITWVRIDFDWGNVQPKSSATYDWTVYDPIVSAIVAHHLNVLGVIAYTPPWARSPNCDGGEDCPPQDPAQFATYAASIAARYQSDGLHYWEIWNEPNDFDFWATKADCGAYTSLLKATYPAVKKVDAHAIIITAGLSPQSTDNVNISPTDFLNCIYSDGGKNYFDAVGDHPYTFPQFPSNNGNNDWANMSQTSPSLRSIMIANGDSAKKIWITEFGAPTNGPDANWYVSENQQAQMLVQAVQLYQTYDWAGPFFWYTLEDGSTATDTNENFFGLIRADGSPKPAFSAFLNLINSGL